MRLCTSIMLFSLWLILWVKSFPVTEAMETGTKRPSIWLNFWQTRKGERSMKIPENTTISIWNGDELYIKCTTKNVHTWDGNFNYGKFVYGVQDIQRNSTGYFSSTLRLKIGTDFFNESSIICKELAEHWSTEKHIVFKNNFKCKTQGSDIFTNDNDKHRESVTIITHPHITIHHEQGISQSEQLKTEDSNASTWLFNLENDYVQCLKANSTGLKIRNIQCDNSLWCKLKANCTAITCVSDIYGVEECENTCHNLSMKLNQPSGQVQCEANGITNYMNYVSDITGKRCFHKPEIGLRNCTVLELEDLDDPLLDGHTTTFYVRTSKNVIINEPEFRVILKNGSTIRLRTLMNNKYRGFGLETYNTFAATLNLTSNMNSIRVIGYQFDSYEIHSRKKYLNVIVGIPPKIEGLPTEIEICGADNYPDILFSVHGHPDPEFSMIFRGQDFYAMKREFIIVKHSGGHYTLTIKNVDGPLIGILTFTAKNVVGSDVHTAFIRADGRPSDRDDWYYLNKAVVTLLVPIVIIKVTVKFYYFLKRQFID